MMDSLTIGRVTGVHGFRIKVELDATSKSPSRAGIAGVQTAVAINSYLSFEIGAGESALGVITDLEAMETLDPYTDEGMTLELVKPRRVASVQLLGTIKTKGASKAQFDPGITVLPTLDTLAQVATAELLDVVFRDAPRRNPPEDVDHGDAYDYALELGAPVASRANRLFASYNDLLSRPLAIVGNTGSGKSYSVASLIQRAIAEVGEVERPRFFILDINGEYGRAFDTSAVGAKAPDTIYLNGVPFSVPVWLMNAREICLWLGAAEQTQEPVLKDFWSLAKGEAEAGQSGPDYLSEAVFRLNGIEDILRPSPRPMNQIVRQLWGQFRGFVPVDTIDGAEEFQALVDTLPPATGNNIFATFADHRPVVDAIHRMRTSVEALMARTTARAQESADKPIYFPLSTLKNPKGLVEAIRGQDDDGRLRQWISTLQLRLNNRLADKRWSCFYNYEALGIDSFEKWLGVLGVGANGRAVNVIDCSMLGYDVLPHVCGIISRVLLELRERVSADKRFKEPWVVVLEEAHNYVRPPRQDEDRGIGISRQSFERIAKEGRKFGFSMMVASQRPSEISQTIVSQCANFVMHRLQNPDDIEHFKNTVPAQSRRLLDQISILASGEAIVFGSAFHVPTRVLMHPPAKTPWSQTAAPYWEWKPAQSKGVDVEYVLREWGLKSEAAQELDENGTSTGT